MIKKLIAKELIKKYIDNNTSNANYTLSNQDNISNKEKTLRNLLIWAEYSYGGTTFNKIAEKFELSYGHTIAICKGMSKKMDKFLKTA